MKEASEKTFRAIAEAEAKVHGTTIEKIHFHEVGAIDSIVDVIGVHLALHHLQIDQVIASPVHLGSGVVKCAHGVMPVPAPATALLLAGVPSYSGEVVGELATPTGAALIRQIATRFSPMPLMTIEKVGYGSGTRNYTDRPNVLRAVLGETQAVTQATESITVMETNIDDMNPELLPTLLAQALAEGARDAFLTPVVGKKGRSGHLVTVLCDDDAVPRVAKVLFSASTTFGIRMRKEDRICLERAIKSVSTPWGKVRVKLGYLDGETIRTAPEFDDCSAIAQTANVPVLKVYEAALAAAVKGELVDA